MKSKPVKAWAVVTARGKLEFMTLEPTKEAAMWRGRYWDCLDGGRVARVEIREVVTRKRRAGK